ncbi:hypothetical protein MKW92_013874, partial [Papaver armeniacum]
KINIICVNRELTYFQNTECADVTSGMKMYYTWDYNQEMIKSEVFWEVLRLLDLLIRDKVHVKAVGRLIWQLKDAVFSQVRVLSASSCQTDVNVEKKEQDLMLRIQLKIIWYNSAACGVQENWILSRVSSGLVPNYSLALYFLRYKSNYFDKYGVRLHNSNFTGDFDFLSSFEWQQLYWVIGCRNCIKCLIVIAGVFITNTQPLFKKLQTSTAQDQDEAVNSMSSSAVQKFSIHLAISAHNSVKYHITRVAMLEP